MAPPSIKKKKIPPKHQPVQAQKKKKNAPDAPQPKWLFPPDQENPVLNPKARTPEEIKQEKDEREKSLDYMQRRVHAAPDRPAPPPELLTLVGIFLTDFGFNSTSRLFTNERKARKVLNGWEDGIGTKIEKGTPTLEQIYRDWYREWKIKKLESDDTSTSESGSDSSDSDSEPGVTTQLNGAESSYDDSEASSDGLGGSDVEMKDPSKVKGKKGKAVKKSPGSSSSSSTSDSDADDENEKKKPKAKTTPVSKTKTRKSATAISAISTKPTVVAMVNKLKRKAESSDEDSDSDSCSSESSEDEKKPAKKTKTSAITTTAVASLPNGVYERSSDEDEESENSEADTRPAGATVKAVTSSKSSSSESSESESSEEEETKPKEIVNGVSPVPKASSDSSATVNGDIKESTDSTSESETSSATTASESDQKPAKPPVKKETKHTGAKPTPLAELSAKGIHGHVSNQYQSYEYAEKAYQDLSVTRGKGFTKEKNKKKRGSYRGGTIDTSGGKGFKFDD